jgi:hypothetical protein
MHDQPPARHIQKPIFDDTRPGVKQGLGREIKYKRRIRDLNHQIQVPRLRPD